jgi:hypothetical protein
VRANPLENNLVLWNSKDNEVIDAISAIADEECAVLLGRTARSGTAGYGTSPALQDCFKTVSVGVVCVTGPGPRSGQRTDRALHAGGALAVESKLGGCVGPRGRARRRDFHRHVRCAASVLGASVEPRVSSWFMGRRGSLLQSRIRRSKAGYGLVAHCQLFVIETLPEFTIA